MSEGIEIKSDHQKVVELIKSADLEKCDMNQLVAIINLYDMLKIPMESK